ncbi:DUF4261 domain-containing protein [Rapidithrix thailandica]|uniref:DUF4261 domain-containing protein n=1 Tax=Rapidithrix thailandica TaxID=413964 RepID=A0AAW9S696_9BACT
MISNTQSLENDHVVIGMVLLEDTMGFDSQKLVRALQEDWQLEVQSFEQDENALVVALEEHNLVFGHIPSKVSTEEIELCAEIAYFWENVQEDIERYQGHVVVSVLGNYGGKVKQYSILTKAIASVLHQTNALGVYMHTQTLLLPKEVFLNEAKSLLENRLPLYNWVYFGLGRTEEKHFGYTFGLQEFGYPEFEVLDSGRSMEELTHFLYDLTYYVMQSNVILEDGVSIGSCAEQTVKVEYSEGVRLEGKTLKLAY